jgi:UDP-glucose 4-epimerase
MKAEGSTILVTGGAGFVGSYIVEELVRAGARVRVYDDFSSGEEANLVGVKNDVEVIRGDILDTEGLLRAASGVDVICHQAAQLEIVRCIESPIEDLRSNTEGTLSILEAAKRLSIPKVVYASSACVYGPATYIPEDEAHPTVPNWPYGVSKLAAEHYARLYYEYYQIETIGLRYSIVYGPREWYGRVLTAFLRRALDQLSPVVWGGDQERDFVYVEDVARLNRLSVESDEVECDVFNVSTGVGTSIRELANLVCDLFGLDQPIYEDIGEGEVSKLVTDRMRLPAELKQMVLDNSRAKETFDWKPVTSLRQGIMSEMDWLHHNTDRWVTMRI